MKTAYAALGAILAYGGLTTPAEAQTDVEPTIGFDNTIQGAVDAQSTNAINLLIGGTVAIKGTVRPDSIGQSLLDAKQLLNDNSVILLTPSPAESGNTTVIYDNDAALGANAFQQATGNVGINIAAGDNMAQDNTMTIATVRSADQGLQASAVALQEAMGNLFNETRNTDALITNDATIASGAFNGAGGNIEVNIAAGAHIGQQNMVSVSVAAANADNVRLASSNVATVQLMRGNHAWIGSMTNVASVGSIGVGASGNLAINVAAGTNILQNNTLAVNAGD